MLTPRHADKGEPVRAYGWVMNWNPYKTSGKKKMGEELSIKTIFKREIDDEYCSIYIGNVVIKDMQLIELIQKSEDPVAVHIEGIKRGERAYMNPNRNEIEWSKRLIWIYLNARGLVVERVEKIPPELLKKTRVEPPPMTFVKHALMMRPKKEAMKRKKRMIARSGIKTAIEPARV